MLNTESALPPGERSTLSRAREGGGWRIAARWGARHGPRWWLRYSPPFFGALGWAVLPRERRRVRRNLTQIIGGTSSWALWKAEIATFANYARCFAEGLAAGRVEAMAAIASLSDASRLESSLAGGRGAVIATAHVGPWDAAAQILGRDIRRSVTAVMAPERILAAREVHDEVRSRAGVRVHHSGQRTLGSLDLLRALRAGEIVVVQLDRFPPDGRAMSATLFGQSVEVPLGPFLLAGLAGVPVVPVFVWRRDFFDYRGEVGEPLCLPRRPTETQLREVVEQATSMMEGFIRRHPTQWFHFS